MQPHPSVPMGARPMGPPGLAGPRPPATQFQIQTSSLPRGGGPVGSQPAIGMGPRPQGPQGVAMRPPSMGAPSTPGAPPSNSATPFHANSTPQQPSGGFQTLGAAPGSSFRPVAAPPGQPSGAPRPVSVGHINGISNGTTVRPAPMHPAGGGPMSAPPPRMGGHPPSIQNSAPRPMVPSTPSAPRPMGMAPPQTPQLGPRPMMGSIQTPGAPTMTPGGPRPLMQAPATMMGPPRPMQGQQRPGSPQMMMPGGGSSSVPSMGMGQRPPSPSMMGPPQMRPPSPGGGNMFGPPRGVTPPGPGMMQPRPTMPPMGRGPMPIGLAGASHPGPTAQQPPRPMAAMPPPGAATMGPGGAPNLARPSPIMAAPTARPTPMGMMPQQPASQQQQHPAMHPPGVSAPPPRLHQQQQQHQAPTRTPRPTLEQIAQPIHFMSQQVEQHTNCLQPFPPASFPYLCIDNGQANCRFMRPTTRLLACSSQVVDEMKLPLAVICTPFADLVPGEVSPVPLSEWTHEHGPVRCMRCKGYLNCYTRASADFSQWECSLCGHANDTPAHYRAFAQGGQAPELRFGSVEFEVPAEFFKDKSALQGQDQDFCFVVDATQVSVMSGLFSISLRTVLHLAKQNVFPENAKIGFITFDEVSVYFYDISGAKPRVLISGDCEEGFSPLPAEGFMVSVKDSHALDSLVQFISLSQTSQQDHGAGKTVSNVGGSALMSAFSALRNSGGRILLLLSSMPTKGQGKLNDREQPTIIGTEQEMSLYSADKEEKFYNELSIRCLSSSIAVDIFCCGAPFMDAAALCQMPSTTGGIFERIAGFQAANPLHRFELEAKLSRTLKSARAMSVAMKARTSSGLRVARYIGHGFPDEGSYKISTISADYSLAIELEHDGTKLEDSKSRGIVQLALLYITPDGKRRLRVHNMAMQAKESPAIVLNAFDPLAVACFWGKIVALELAESGLSKVRDGLVRRLMDALRTIQKLGGRRQTGEPLELLTLYVLSLLKSPALMLNRPLDRGVREPYARADARIYSRFHFLWVSPERFSTGIYPALYDITDQQASMYGEPLPIVAPSVDHLPDPGAVVAKVRLPPRVPCCSEFLRSEGLFLLYNGGEQLDLFIGSRANPQIVEQILGMIPTPEVKVGLISERNKLSQAVYRVCKQLLEDIGGVALPQAGQPIPVAIASGASPEFFSENKQFLASLVEDKIYAEQSYGSFVNHVFQLMESAKG